MRRRGTSRGQAGFTLIEAMIAMFFLAFMVGELGMIFVYASRNTNLSQRIGRANQLADEAIEITRNTDYDNLEEGIGALGEPATTATSHTSTIDNGRYTRVRTITPYDRNGNVVAFADSNRSDVDVVVTFDDARGLEQTIRVSSVVSRYY